MDTRSNTYSNINPSDKPYGMSQSHASGFAISPARTTNSKFNQPDQFRDQLDDDSDTDVADNAGVVRKEGPSSAYNAMNRTGVSNTSSNKQAVYS